LKTDFAILDVDGTILSKRSIDVICDKFGFTSKLKEIDDKFGNAPRILVTRKMAQLLAGMKRNELVKIFDSIPFNSGVIDLIEFFKERDFIVALATDGYKFLADRLKERLPIDLVYGNILEFNDEILTGEVLTRPACLQIPNCKKYLICKLRLLKSMKGALGGIAVAIGDSESDYCMFEGADISIAYRPKNERIKSVVNVFVQEFSDAIKYLTFHLE